MKEHCHPVKRRVCSGAEGVQVVGVIGFHARVDEMGDFNCMSGATALMFIP